MDLHHGEWRARVSFPRAPTRPKRLRVWFSLGAAIGTNAIDEKKARALALGLARLAAEGKLEPPAKGAAPIVRHPTDALIPDRAEDGTETVKGWTLRWLEARRDRGHKSMRSDESRLRTWVWPWIGAVPAAALTRDHIERVVELLDESVSEGECEWKTAQNAWGLVSKLCADMRGGKPLSLRVRKDNPAEGVTPPDRGARKAKQFLYPSEFLSLVSSREVPLDVREVYAVAVYLYPRAGELEALHCEDVDLDHGTVHLHRARHADTGEIRETKGNRPRRVPIHAHLLPLLKRLHARAGGLGLLWPEWPLWKDQAGQLRRYLEVAGATRAELHAADCATTKPMTFHDLRATGITWEAVAGTDALRIQRRAGHASLSTTQVYLRLAESVGVQGFGAPFPPLPTDLTAEADLVPSTVPQTGGGRIEAHRDGAGAVAKAHEMAVSQRLATSRYAPNGFESLSPNYETLQNPAETKTSAPDGGPTGGPTPETPASLRGELVETLTRMVAAMSAAGDIAGARIALASLQRLLGEVPGAASYAPPVAVDGDSAKARRGGGTS